MYNRFECNSNLITHLTLSWFRKSKNIAWDDIDIEFGILGIEKREREYIVRLEIWECRDWWEGSMSQLVGCGGVCHSNSTSDVIKSIRPWENWIWAAIPMSFQRPESSRSWTFWPQPPLLRPHCRWNRGRYGENGRELRWLVQGIGIWVFCGVGSQRLETRG